MPAPDSSVAAGPRTFAELRRGVEQVIVAGRRSIEHAWVRTYHETGRLITEHMLLNAGRADYGAKVIARLADETKISQRTLHECVQFHRCFPIVRPGAQLGWKHYRLLCQVPDERRRAALLAETIRRNWPAAELESRVRAGNAAIDLASAESGEGPTTASVKILKPRRGMPGLFRVVARDEGLAVDVGFKLYRPLSSAEARGWAVGGIVRHDADGGGFAAAKDAVAAELFTYRAMIRRVVDGDTLLVTLALPHYAMDEKLRLRGLDCPEMDTAEGKAAKRFTEALLVDATEVFVATSKVDKYDRYLADVHVRCATGEEIFLNNALLEHSHAVPMGNEAMTDWTP